MRWLSLFFLLGCFLVTPAQGQEKPIGKVISIIGTVEYAPEPIEPVAEAKPGEVQKVAFEPWEKVKKLQPVYAKDRFRTSRKSRLKLLFSDNSLMALGPGSEMSVEAYRHDPGSKLRQGIIKVKRGLTMYIVNKSQKHKKSFFNIITSTATIGARGTQGYIASSPGKTLIANQAGAVATKNSDPKVKGQRVVGAMMKSVIARGKPPSKPTPLQKSELNAFRNIILARIGSSSGKGADGKPLIEVEEKEEDEEEEEEEESSESEESSDSESSESEESEESEDSEESADSEESSESGDSEESTESSDSEDSGSDDKGETKSSDSQESQESQSNESAESSGPDSTESSNQSGDGPTDSGGSDIASGPADSFAATDSFDAGGDTGSFGGDTGAVGGDVPASMDFEVAIMEVISENFDAGGGGSFGTSADFAGVFEPFNDSQSESCSP